jgi:hypothetical protein
MNTNYDSSLAPRCPICGDPLLIRLATGRKSGKPFVMMLCSQDGRHFRGFISHRPYVEQFVAKLESIRLNHDGVNR